MPRRSLDRIAVSNSLLDSLFFGSDRFIATNGSDMWFRRIPGSACRTSFGACWSSSVMYAWAAWCLSSSLANGRDVDVINWVMDLSEMECGGVLLLWRTAEVMGLMYLLKAVKILLVGRGEFQPS